MSTVHQNVGNYDISTVLFPEKDTFLKLAFSVIIFFLNI